MPDSIQVRCAANIRGAVGENLLTPCGKKPVAMFAFSSEGHAFPLCQEHFDWAQRSYDELDLIVAGKS